MPSPAIIGQSLISGTFIGALYALLGLGLSLSWGMLRQINLAHFALAFLGAYLTYQLSGVGGMDPLLTLLLIAPAFFLLGVGMHWVFVRFAVGPLGSLLATFGLTVIIESVIQWIWTADFLKLESPYGSASLRVGIFYLPVAGLITLAAAAALCFGTWAVLRYTDLGRAMRAAAEDGPMAAAFGVNVNALSRLLSGFASACAGVAGVALALSYTLAPSQIYAWIGVIFAVVMIGGLGKPLGPLIAGLVIGVSEAVTMALTAPAWAPVVSFSLLILVLLARARNI